MKTLPPQHLGRPVRKARAALIRGEAISRLSELFDALGDPTRLKMILALSAGELCVADLAQAIDMSESAVSHQLRFLKSLRLIRFRRSGKQVFYALDDDHVGALVAIGMDHIGELGR